MNQILLKGDVNYCINYEAPIFYEYLLHKSTLKLQKILQIWPRSFVNSHPDLFLSNVYLFLISVFQLQFLILLCHPESFPLFHDFPLTGSSPLFGWVSLHHVQVGQTISVQSWFDFENPICNIDQECLLSLQVLRKCLTFLQWSPRLNFINVLCTAFTLIDPKRYWQLDLSSYALGSYGRKSCT